MEILSFSQVRSVVVGWDFVFHFLTLLWCTMDKMTLLGWASDYDAFQDAALPPLKHDVLGHASSSLPQYSYTSILPKCVNENGRVLLPTIPEEEEPDEIAASHY